MEFTYYPVLLKYFLKSTSSGLCLLMMLMSRLGLQPTQNASSVVSSTINSKLKSPSKLLLKENCLIQSWIRCFRNSVTKNFPALPPPQISKYSTFPSLQTTFATTIANNRINNNNNRQTSTLKKRIKLLHC